jgi:hypothetical protein
MTYTLGLPFDLSSMHGLTGHWSAVVGTGTVVVHVVAWPYTAALLTLRAAYRLLAERARRKTLMDLVSHAPVGTIVVVDKGPGGPAMGIRVGGEVQVQPPMEVWRGQF